MIEPTKEAEVEVGIGVKSVAGPVVQIDEGRIQAHLDEVVRSTVSWFQNLFDARRKITLWRRDYNEQRPHSSLKYRTPAEFAAEASYGKDVGSAHFENADGVSNFPTATAAAG